MTPKEKAEDIVRKYSTYVVMWSGGIEVERQNVKQCALISVDEMLKELESIDDGQTVIPYNYWQEVKQEIEKL
jgi:hypothetical protein